MDWLTWATTWKLVCLTCVVGMVVVAIILAIRGKS